MKNTAIPLLIQLSTWLMALYLLADMASGFFVIYYGIDLKISLIYKTPLFIILIVIIGRYDLRMTLFIISLTLLFFIGPGYQFIKHSNLDFLFFDFAGLIKTITPFTVLVYFKILFKQEPEYADKAIEKILRTAAVILSLNFILGILGFGKNTYQLSDEEGAGSTGFILAGNELGPTFLIAFGYVLFHLWNERTTFLYTLFSLFTLLSGLLVATKTSILASILIVSLIPIVSERHNLYTLTPLKLKIAIPFITLVGALIYLIFDLLQAIGLYERIMWFYEQRGAIGILLSGRDIMVEERMATVLNHSSFFEQLFGQGQALGLKSRGGLVGTEIDSVDVFIQYGIIPLVFLSFFYIWIVCVSHNMTLKGDSYIAPYVFICSLVLLILSQLSGHIWTSGTLGILFGVMMSCLYKSSCNETN